MGLLVEGQWHDVWYRRPSRPVAASCARTRRSATGSRVDGSAGPSGIGGFKAEAGRYHLYVSLACPWAHRTLIMRLAERARRHDLGVGGALADAGTRLDFRRRPRRRSGHRQPCASSCIRSTLPPIRTTPAASPFRCSGTSTRAPSSTTNSSEIIRMLNSAFDEIGAKPGDYYPQALRGEIDAVNARIYDTLNNGVYKAGLRDDAGGLRGSGHPAVRDARLARAAACRPALSVRRQPDRSRHPAVHDADPLRRGLCRAFQVQHPPARRLSQSVGLCARHLPMARRRRDGEFRTYPAALLREPPLDQSKRDRSRRARARFHAPHGREHRLAASTPSRNVAIDRDCASTGSAVMGIANGNPSI